MWTPPTTTLYAVVFCLISQARLCAAGAYCGGFDLGNHGQASQCLSDSASHNGCYNIYGRSDSCWSQVAQSQCCSGGGHCSNHFDNYNGNAYCVTPPPPPVPVDCDGYWGDWSSCSERCGGGTKTRTYTITRQDANGGLRCPSSVMDLEQSTPCNTDSCALPPPPPPTPESGGACPYTNDGECDEPKACPLGTDYNDCAGANGQSIDRCQYAGDGECDVPKYCPDGSDIVDCGSPSTYSSISCPAHAHNEKSEFFQNSIDMCDNTDITVEWSGGIHDSAVAEFGAQQIQPSLHEDLELVVAKPIDGCDALGNVNAAGKIVLVERGTCPFAEKTMNAQRAGAAAVIIYNNEEGTSISGMAGTNDDITILAVMIARADGIALATAASESTTTVSLRCGGDHCACDSGYEALGAQEICIAVASCPYESDGECDVPQFCSVGTDTADCGVIAEPANDNSCRYANDGECDEPQYCDAGTDCTDCNECGGHRRLHEIITNWMDDRQEAVHEMAHGHVLEHAEQHHTASELDMFNRH